MSLPPLTQRQKEQLHILEPCLRDAAKSGDIVSARTAMEKIQVILRNTGHETRLMQAKNWYFMAVMNYGELETARMGFEGIRKKTSNRTRVFLEATAQETICLLRKGDIDKARPMIAETFSRVGNIKSSSRQQQFRQRAVQVFEDEWALALLRQKNPSVLDVDEVEERAAFLLRNMSEEEIDQSAVLGIPEDRVSRLLEVYEFSRNQLPSADRQRLPSPESRCSDQKKGRALIDSVKRITWHSLCDKDSEVYKMWYSHGMMCLLDKKLITSAVIASAAQLKIGYFALTAAVVATIMKAGIEVFCDRWHPLDLMIDRTE